ncbi:MAG: transcriptional regulator [Planifilum sp.]|jgi:DNA-binding MarR family transcriptional regulator
MPFRELAQLDKLIHEPARLAILNALAIYNMAEFLFLQEVTGLTKGNLSCHLSKLEKAHLISINKHFVRKKIPQTTVQITPEGRAAVENYWRQLDRIRSAIDRAKGR